MAHTRQQQHPAPQGGPEDISSSCKLKCHKENLKMKSIIDITLITTLGVLLILAGFDNIRQEYSPYWSFLLFGAGVFIIWWPHICNLSED